MFGTNAYPSSTEMYVGYPYDKDPSEVDSLLPQLHITVVDSQSQNGLYLREHFNTQQEYYFGSERYVSHEMHKVMGIEIEEIAFLTELKEQPNESELRTYHDNYPVIERVTVFSYEDTTWEITNRHESTEAESGGRGISPQLATLIINDTNIADWTATQ
jgi:hypothetical protein